MLGCGPFPLLPLNVFFLIGLSVQVDITFTGIPSGYGHAAITNTCTNIQPGECCMVIAFDGARTARFDHLAVEDITAVWGPERRVRSGGFAEACAHVVLGSRSGPGSWTWQSDEQGTGAEIAATGASYIRVPKSLPPNPTTSLWLQTEGMLALIWGGGSWFASEGAKARWGRGVRPRSRLRREHSWAEKGKLWAKSPPRMAFPDVVEVEGEVYRGNGSGDMMFTDSRGAKVNLTSVWMSAKPF